MKATVKYALLALLLGCSGKTNPQKSDNVRPKNEQAEFKKKDPVGKRDREPKQEAATSEAERKAVAEIKKLKGEVVGDPASYVDFSRSNISDADLIRLKELPELKHLILSDQNVTDGGVSHLKVLKALRQLVLSGTKITDAAFAKLGTMANLNTLDLSQTKITDVGLGHLTGMAELRILGLHSTPVSDAGLAHLHKLANLKVLTLTETKVTDAGVEMLKKALPKCVVVK
jgi:hypothetical protein